MYLKSSGKPSKIPVKLCKQATRFFGKRLLSENLYHKIEITLRFEEFKKNSNEYAYCEWDDDNHRCREFTITLDRNLSKRNLLLAIAHEMVHVKQYAKGELKDYLKVNKSKWKGEVIDPVKVDYWEHPWEIEAHGREKGLYYKFLDHMRTKMRK
jgi:hypothetical protein